MELSKSILVLLLFSCLLSFSTEATWIAFGPAANSPSPSPIKYDLLPHIPCKSLFSTAYNNPFKLPKSINPSLDNICAITENPANCVTLISPCVTGSINSFSALEAVMISLIEHVQNALSFALKLRKNKSTSSEILTAINISIDIYVEIIEDLRKALGAFKGHNIDTVKTILTASITNFGRCDEAFHQQGLTKNWPLKKIDNILIELAGFGLDIYAKLIVKVHN
ncbi:conserved hypothetical protein [Ricinus communis]|uniref:Pectinesterase inhibitor domain-containing protein n=1 Tax=Ricinus communis TaxID=3988 RepID=B9RQR1_RICCO|nr:conserved hypothetical protein [Ricinus communis]